MSADAPHRPTTARANTAQWGGALLQVLKLRAVLQPLRERRRSNVAADMVFF